MSWVTWQPIVLEYDGVNIELLQCLRLLPKKRCAAKAELNGKTVFAKVFFQHNHRNAASLEMDYLQRLKQYGARVPAILDHYSDNNSSILITEWLDDAELLEDLLEEEPAVLKDALEQIRTVYSAGYAQGDLHFGNFVISNKKAWIIDTADLKTLSSKKEVRNRQITENLALLCAQVSANIADKIVSVVVDTFSEQLQSIGTFQRYYLRARNKRIKKIIKKCQRETSSVAVLSRPEGKLFLDRTYEDEQQQFLSYINQPGKLPIIKQDHQVQIYGDGQWVVKHYLSTALKTRFKYRLGLSTPQLSWSMGRTLDLVGFPTPKPVAFAANNDGSGIIITPHVEGERLSDILKSTAGNAELCQKRTVEWLDLMEQWGFWHGNLKAQNILCRDGQVWFINLESAGWSSNTLICDMRMTKSNLRSSLTK